MSTGLTRLVDHPSSGAPRSEKELFRVRFQRALRSCVRRRFSVAECFGVVWLETLEEIPLTDQEQSELYEQLIDWAKYLLFLDVIHSHSPGLFTPKRRAVGGNPECLSR